MTYFSNIGTSSSNCVVLGNPLNNFFLLELIVNNFNLLLSLIFELSPKH